ncbi:hypothetical protein HAX54_022107, partial [Datura stramonium]|nr:hypothetical protein [Datura stramonium]
ACECFKQDKVVQYGNKRLIFEKWHVIHRRRNLLHFALWAVSIRLFGLDMLLFASTRSLVVQMCVPEVLNFIVCSSR